MKNIYPRPVESCEGRALGVIGEIQIIDARNRWNGNPVQPNNLKGHIDVEIFLDQAPPYDGFLREKKHLVKEEGFFLEIKKISNKKAAIWVYAITARGYYYAFQTWLQLQNHPISEGWILDYPKMKRRGFVEGYYGKPWSMEERIRAFTLLSAQKMNTYVYAPKNDRYHREAWAELYPHEKLEQLSMLIHQCQGQHLDFVFAVSPGLSIEYSSSKHVQLLFTKFKQVYDLGVRHFGLFFDDIPLSLMHETDRSRFHGLPEAHISITLSIFPRFS